MPDRSLDGIHPYGLRGGNAGDDCASRTIIQRRSRKLGPAHERLVTAEPSALTAIGGRQGLEAFVAEEADPAAGNLTDAFANERPGYDQPNPPSAAAMRVARAKRFDRQHLRCRIAAPVHSVVGSAMEDAEEGEQHYHDHREADRDEQRPEAASVREPRPLFAAGDRRLQLDAELVDCSGPAGHRVPSATSVRSSDEARAFSPRDTRARALTSVVPRTRATSL